MEYTVVENQDSIDELGQLIADSDWIAVDSEADSLHHYHEKVCLIQFTIRDKHYLVDSLANLDISDFLKTLDHKHLLFHAAFNDLHLFFARFGFEPEGEIFDTMLAAQLLGFKKLGYDALVDHFFDVQLKKTFQKADWSKRPLPEKLLNYAYNDTKFLKPLRDELSELLREKGRLSWHKESCKHLVKTSRLGHPRDPDQVWRIKYISKLNPKQLLYVRELWFWRDDLASNADLPAFRIMDNSKLLDLAVWIADHPDHSIRDCPHLPKKFKETRLSTLKEVIRNTKLIPESEYPQHNPRVHKPEIPDEFQILRQKCYLLADKLELEAPVIASRKTLEQISLAAPGNIEELKQNVDILNWQAELLEPIIKDIWGK